MANHSELPPGTRVRVEFVATVTCDGSVCTELAGQSVGLRWLALVGATLIPVGDTTSKPIGDAG